MRFFFSRLRRCARRHGRRLRGRAGSDDAAGAGKPRVGQIALSYDPEEQIAVKRAMDQFRWFPGGWRVNAELPLPASFDQASKTVREKDVTTQMPRGPQVELHVASVGELAAAGFTHIALAQVRADTRERFVSWAASHLLPALRGQSRLRDVPRTPLGATSS